MRHCNRQVFFLTSSIFYIFGIASFKSSIPAAGVVSPSSRRFVAPLSALPHPTRSKPSTGSACLLEHPAHDAKPPSVWWRSSAARVWSHDRVAAPSGAGTAVPDEAGVQEDKAPCSQVKQDEGEEADRFSAEVSLYPQERLGHAGSLCLSDTLSQWRKLIKQRNQYQLSLHSHRTDPLGIKGGKKSVKVS